MARRTGQLASETTNWIPLGITFIFIGIQLLMVFIQLISPGAADFGNPFAGGTDTPNDDIIVMQSGERSAAMLGHYFVNHDNDADEKVEPFKRDIQDIFYCSATFNEPDGCISPVTFEYTDFNDTVWERFAFGAFRATLEYRTGIDVESTRRVDSGYLNASGQVGSFAYRIPMQGGTTTRFAYDIETPNMGGIQWD